MPPRGDPTALSEASGHIKSSYLGLLTQETRMGRRFAELAFTPLVKEQQQQHGSRHLYERVEQSLSKRSIGIVLSTSRRATQKRSWRRSWSRCVIALNPLRRKTNVSNPHEAQEPGGAAPSLTPCSLRASPAVFSRTMSRDDISRTAYRTSHGALGIPCGNF
jgi:hypothetical protein